MLRRSFHNLIASGILRSIKPQVKQIVDTQRTSRDSPGIEQVGKF